MYCLLYCVIGISKTKKEMVCSCLSQRATAYTLLIWPDTIVQGQSTCCCAAQLTQIVVSFTVGCQVAWKHYQIRELRTGNIILKLNVRGTQISSTIAWVPILFRYWDLNNVVDTITFNWSNEGRTFLLKAEYLGFVNLETIGSQISYFDLKWVTFMVLSYYWKWLGLKPPAKCHVFLCLLATVTAEKAFTWRAAVLRSFTMLSYNCNASV